MALSRGTRLGSYEIVGALGAGGMSACGQADAAATGSRSEASASVRAPGGVPNAAAALGCRRGAPSPVLES